LAFAKDEGFYVGASIGAATIEQSGSQPDLGDFEIDDSDYAHKLFGGYQFSPLFAVEGSYRDLGKPSSKTATTALDGFDAFAVAGLPLGPLRVFGKLGGIYWQSTTRFDGGAKKSSDGFAFAAGAGVELEIGSLGLRGEVERLDVLDGAWMYSIGLSLTF
jgi:hypothetical protein